MTKCEKCKEKVNLLNADVYFGPGWIRWVCPKCNYELNYERTSAEPIDTYVEKIILKNGMN